MTAADAIRMGAGLLSISVPMMAAVLWFDGRVPRRPAWMWLLTAPLVSGFVCAVAGAWLIVVGAVTAIVQ